MVSSLVNVSPDLAKRVAAGLGMPVPSAMPRALTEPCSPEVTQSPALSLAALLGNGGIRTRKVALLVAPGIDATSLLAVQQALTASGAIALYVGPRLGTIKTAQGTLEAAASTENMAPVLFDGLVIPDGGVEALAADVHVMEFVQSQYRHGKTLLALGTGRQFLEQAGALALGEKSERAGIVVSKSAQINTAIEAFIAALAQHRHPLRQPKTAPA